MNEHTSWKSHLEAQLTQSSRCKDELMWSLVKREMKESCVSVICYIIELLIECCVLRAACCVLRAACCVLRAACCVLRVACCVLRVACCVLRVAC